MRYRAQVFDVDGTLLRTNGVKAGAFRAAALPYGEAEAEALVAYHRRAGSIGRRARFEWFFREVLRREPTTGEVERLLAACTREVLRGTLAAPKVPGAERYLASLRGCDRLVVSGIESGELERILCAHGLMRYLDRVWGSPPEKRELLRSLVASADIALPAVYYGDTEDDFRAARGAGLDFVLVACDSEWAGGREVCRAAGARVVEDFREVC